MYLQNQKCKFQILVFSFLKSTDMGIRNVEEQHGLRERKSTLHHYHCTHMGGQVGQYYHTSCMGGWCRVQRCAMQQLFFDLMQRRDYNNFDLMQLDSIRTRRIHGFKFQKQYRILLLVPYRNSTKEDNLLIIILLAILDVISL